MSPSGEGLNDNRDLIGDRSIFMDVRDRPRSWTPTYRKDRRIPNTSRFDGFRPYLAIRGLSDTRESPRGAKWRGKLFRRKTDEEPVRRQL